MRSPGTLLIALATTFILLTGFTGSSNATTKGASTLDITALQPTIEQDTKLLTKNYSKYPEEMPSSTRVQFLEQRETCSVVHNPKTDTLEETCQIAAYYRVIEQFCDDNNKCFQRTTFIEATDISKGHRLFRETAHRSYQYK